MVRGNTNHSAINPDPSFLIRNSYLITLILLGALALCVLVQLWFVLFRFLPLSKHQDPEPDVQRPVSVIVAAHDELENLVELLPQLLDQDYPEFEVLLVNDRSEDDTEFYTFELERQFPNFRVVTIKKTPDYLNPKKYALALGIRAAKYEHLLFTDADCRPCSKNWIQKMQSGYSTGAEVVLGYAPYAQLKGFLNRLIRYETLLTGIQYLSQANRGRAYMGVGRNLSYTKACFFKNKGFASHIKQMGGDDDLFVRDAARNSKVSVVIDKEAQTLSVPKNNYREWVVQKRRHLSVGGQYKAADRRRIGVFVVSNILFYLLFVILVVSNSHFAILSVLVIVRYLAVFPVYLAVARRLDDEIPLLLMPVLDVVYFVNYLFLGISVLLYKKFRWK
ncbi:glycosyltransferase [Pontibacter akesuensis]|uniref:Glycosyltransferase, catalytic subunit of cellulose synthase and poly-beta-1,6-N-acetylglucosamine synthase n=1 Tax=Pontibacter akesuensis TaxID=388950 RepID=A0A1I7J538_9BACT|nr:glycosyltransferase [Pontibacter akesuensis]GHA72396.1 glycosyl transferase family 2 [Pontibacter akesuensis]SFU80242.1 Glycosyltransferase, catalytic subunit of cellulose synthase and poly-beta-1,6-N-acetylglucosamine synthase [Pontibacter akesuensis]